TISVPGSYRLSSNLTVNDPNTNAIDITTSGVSIDLNGFSILGPAVCSGALCSPAGSGSGIVGTTGGGFSVSAAVGNGEIRGMPAFGICFNGDSIHIDRIRAVGNGKTGIFIQQSHGIANDNIISSTIASFNGED